MHIQKLVLFLPEKLRSPFLEFAKYTFVGGIATVVDWSIFYELTHPVHLHFRLALTISFVCGTITHYFLNRHFTFKFKTREYRKQLPIYASAMAVSLLVNALIMEGFVSIFHLPLMPARVVTTALMLMVNYTIHKWTTFNRRLFSDS